tara:strand:- start:646 stop:1359 length:714 start_codon:yes stop_codon:yes gene_type:complete
MKTFLSSIGETFEPEKNMSKNGKSGKRGENTKKRLVIWIDVLNPVDVVLNKMKWCCCRLFCCCVLKCCVSKETIHYTVLKKVGKKLSEKLHGKGIHNEAYIVDNKIKVIVRKLPWIAQMSVKSKIERSVRKGLEKQHVKYDLEVNRERTSIRLYRYDREEVTSDLEKALLERDRDRALTENSTEVGDKDESRRRDSSWIVRILGRRGTDASCEDFEGIDDLEDNEERAPTPPPRLES